MKKAILLFGLGAMLLASCSEDDAAPVQSQPEVSGNKVLMLKVDFLTFAFEGGKELSFPEADSFTIDPEYVSPGDFGSLKLLYDEVDQPLFDGTITWMGLGERSYPATLAAPQTFEMIENAVEMPAAANFELINYIEGSGDTPLDEEWINRQMLWNAIDNVAMVKEYRESNPDAKVHFFAYTPSVGVGNPAEWDWYVFIKN